MMRSVAWERPLRRRLKQVRGVRGRAWSGRLAVVWSFAFWGFAALVLNAALVREGFDRGGAALGGMAAGGIGGLADVWLGILMRGALNGDVWIGVWGPVTRREVRRLQMRGFLPAVARIFAGLAVVTWLGSSWLGGLSLWQAFAATALAAVVGFGLVWGRVTLHLVWLGLVGCVGVAFLAGWQGEDASARMLEAISHLWLPSMPWSWLHSPVSYVAVQILLLAGLLAKAAAEGLAEWRYWAPPNVLGVLPHDEEPTEEASDGKPLEALQREVRQSVHQCWVGMAGYLGPTAPRGFDAILWRRLTARERWLSCMGSQVARTWFPQTRWAVVLLVLMVSVNRLTPAAWVERMAEVYPVGWVVVHLVLCWLALVKSWPGKNSAFQPLLHEIPSEGLGRVPALALLPVSGREWLRATAKEWVLRSAWTSLLWGPVVVLMLPQLIESAAGSLWLALAPVLLLAAAFPGSALRQVVLALAGEMGAAHGSGKVIPAAVLALGCLVSAFGAISFALAGVAFPVCVCLCVAVLCGTFGVSLTVDRIENPRLDQRPRK